MTKIGASQNFTQRLTTRSRTQKWILWAAMIAAFYTLVGFFALSPIVKMVLEKKLPELLHRQVTIDKIRLNPYALTTVIEGFALKRKDTQDNLISFERVFVNLQLASFSKWH